MFKSYLLKSQFVPSKYPSLYGVRDNRDLILRLGLDNKLDVHTGCINTISWSDDDCNLILSGSDDQNLSITDAFSGQKKKSLKTNHKANIFCAKFMPNTNSEKIVSCAADGSLYLTNINESFFSNSNKNKFECHGDKAVYEISNYPQDNQCFATCGQDGCIKIFDLRTHSKCEKSFCHEHTLIKLSTGISALAINPFIPYHLVCSGLDGIVRFYDRRKLSVGSSFSSSKNISQSTDGMFACFKISKSNEDTIGGTVVSSKRVTSLQFDNWGNDLLVSYQPDTVYLLDWRDLSMDNKNEISNYESNESNHNSSQARKFRIATDWSDTGPTSMPINETIDNNDPRSFLLRRLNDWFSDFYQNRTVNTRTDLNNAHNNQLPVPPPPPQQSPTSYMDTTEETASFNNLDKDDENMNEEYDEDETDENNNNNNKNGTNYKKRNSSDSGEENTNETSSNKQQKSNLTSYLIGSRFKMKQAIRLENNIIKNKPSPKIKQIFTGHRNARTMIKECNFWGNDHVVSGSDCGHIFIWEKKSGKIVNIIEADKHVVNCVQENPLYSVLASSGIDYDIKIWQPILKESVDINSKVEILTKRNKMMLNEIKNTIFIPVQFMVPALRLFGANMRNNNRTNNINNQNRNETSGSNQNTE